MRASVRIVLSLVMVAAPGACGKKNVALDRIAGSFVRQDALIPGLVTRLHVTPSGMTVTSPSVSVGTSQSIEVRGEPLVKGSARMELGVAAQGAALFSSLACDGDACAFATKNGCEGTLTADAKGDVVLVATGACGPWSGKWLREKDTPERPDPSAAPVCPPLPACPPPSACPPCASGTAPSPSATASADPMPGPQGRAECMQECGHAQMRCVQECKIADSECLQRCSATVSKCVGRCR